MRNTVSLNQNQLFLRVYQRGKKSYHRHFILYYFPNRLGVNRLGLKVGKKLAKAVRRNRVRRLLKESYRLLEAELKVGYDIVIVARPSCLSADTYSEVSGALRNLFANAKLLRSEND